MENMEIYKCSGCGKVIETLPQCCAQDMFFNEKKTNSSVLWAKTVDM